MGECWNCSATADDDWSCQACRTERALTQDLADAGREIEALRAENENLRAALAIKDNHDHFDCTAERQELRLKVAELQALIDAWAAAADWSWVPGDPTNALAAAEDALLAAATKNGDDQ